MNDWDHGKKLYQAGRPCAKCGHHLVTSRYVNSRPIPDFIKRECQRCEYSWYEIPFDRAS